MPSFSDAILCTRRSSCDGAAGLRCQLSFERPALDRRGDRHDGASLEPSSRTTNDLFKRHDQVKPPRRERGTRLLASVAGFAAVVVVVVATGVPAGGGVLQLAVMNRSAGPGGALGALARTVARQFPEPPPTSTPRAPGIEIAISHKFDMPDPFLLSTGGKYYIYMSNAFGDATNSNVPVLSGEPGHWSSISDALPVVPSWALSTADRANVWDPYVVYLDGRYVMYYSPSLADDPNPTSPTHCIGVAVSFTPQGPFVPFGDTPLICQTSLGGDIDAQLFVDPYGPKGPAHPNYLIWKSDNNNLQGAGPTTVWAAPMSNDGLSVAGRGVPIFRPSLAWEEPVLEAPQMVLAPNRTDWLFFSAGSGFYTPRYAMGAASCAGPLGGCRNAYGRPLISSDEQGSGPGEETVFVSRDHTTWLLYNPWHQGESYGWFRPVEAARIGWDARGPYVAEAGRFPAPGA